MDQLVSVNKFERYFNKDGNCWLWKGTIHAGYGRYCVKTDKGHRYVSAHRYSYELYIGKIPEKLVINHLCNNTSCVNPEHLEAVTQKQNIAYAVLCGRTAKGAKSGAHTKPWTRCRGENHYYNLNPEKILREESHGMAKLAWPDIRNIREEYNSLAKTATEIAKEYGVSLSNISSILRNNTWYDENYRINVLVSKYNSVCSNSKMSFEEWKEKCRIE